MGKLAALLLVHAAVVLGGVYYMLTEFGKELDSELDDQVTRVERDFERDLNRIRADVRRELRRLAPATPTP